MGSPEIAHKNIGFSTSLSYENAFNNVTKSVMISKVLTKYALCAQTEKVFVLA